MQGLGRQLVIGHVDGDFAGASAEEIALRRYKIAQVKIFGELLIERVAQVVFFEI